jgi:hypothetical protein
MTDRYAYPCPLCTEEDDTWGRATSFYTEEGLRRHILEKHSDAPHPADEDDDP